MSENTDSQEFESPPPATEDTRTFATAAVEILDQAADRFGLEFERAEVRRAVTEATHTWPGETESLWWKWVVEAAASLDLRASVVDATVDDVLLWIRDGVRVIIHLPDEPSWLLITGHRSRKVTIFEPGRGLRRKSIAALKRLINKARVEGTIRVVAIEPGMPSAPGHYERQSLGRDVHKPLTRVFYLVKLEWSDVWVILVFSLLTGILALATPMAVQVMVSLVAFGRLLQPVVVVSLLLLGLTGFWAALRVWETYIAEIIQRRLFARVVHDLSYRLPRVNTEALDGEYGPELVNRFLETVTIQKVTTQFLLDAVNLFMASLVGMAVLAVYHPWMLGLDLALITMILFIVFVLGRGGVRTSMMESKYKYYSMAWLEEIARCPNTFKLDNSFEFAADKAEHLIAGYLENRRLHFRVLLRQITFALVLHALTGSVLLGVGGWLVIQGQLTLGQLVAAEMIVAIIVQGISKMGKHIEGFYDLMASVDKLGVLFDLPLERRQGLMRLPETGPANLSIRNISYAQQSRPLLSDFSLELEPGERVAIAGDPGSGKSMLADLIYGLRTPSQGRILIDQHDLVEVRPDVWRRHVMLLRHSEVFHGSLTENIHMDHPDIDVRLVREACEGLGLLDDERLPDGLETELASSGAPLSSLQQIQLTLARALVHQPRVLIIDGLLDALHGPHLEVVRDLIWSRSAPWTLLVFTNHPEIQTACDRVVTLE